MAKLILEIKVSLVLEVLCDSKERICHHPRHIIPNEDRCLLSYLMLSALLPGVALVDLS